VPFLQDLPGAVINVTVLLLSLTVHEFFHAWTAWRLGDDTAARMGRLTLNPIPHIDVFGTLILPLIGAPIGWAKPVPVNSARFRQGVNRSTGDILVSAAGPLSNIGFGLLMAVVFGVLARTAPASVGAGTFAHAILIRFMLVNASLAVFNLLPIPPLDGGHVAENLMPQGWRAGWSRFAQVAPMLLIGLLVLENVSSVRILSAILGPMQRPIYALYNLIVGAIAS
jgi:Zn-dependent protease